MSGELVSINHFATCLFSLTFKYFNCTNNNAESDPV